MIGIRIFEAGELRLVEAWIDEEQSLQDALIERLRIMQGLIVADDVGSLENYLVESSDLLKKMESLERRRKKIYQSVLGPRGLVPGKDSLRRLTDFAPTQDRESLASRLALLEGAARTVRLLNNRNGMLARSALELGEEFVRRVFLAPTGTQTYDTKGRTRVRPDMILDRSF